MATRSLALYRTIADALTPHSTREAAMQQVVDALWNALHDDDVSWVGFYIDQPDQPDDSRMILGPSRDSPACSPIGLHGVCGQCLVQRTTQIVADVTALGGSYIACDPRDKAEIVLPLINDDVCWAVLDLDSQTADAFSEDDAAGLRAVLDAAGL